MTPTDYKILPITPPGAIVDNASLTCAEVDSLGFDWVDFFIYLGATDVAMAALKLQESDVSGSGFTDVPNANFATATQVDGVAASLPGATDDNHFFGIRVNKQGRKRFLKLVATGGDGTAGAYITAFAVLSRAKQGISSKAQRGLTQELYA